MRLGDHRRAAREVAAHAGGGTKPLAAADGGVALAERINKEYRMCVEAGRSAVEHAMNCGELLRQAQEAADDGDWLRWLRENFEGSKSTAYDYIKLAKNRGYIEAEFQRAGNLSLRHALALISPPSSKPDGDDEEGVASVGKEAIRKPRKSGPSELGAAKPRRGTKQSTDREPEFFYAGHLPDRGVLVGRLAELLGEDRGAVMTCELHAGSDAGKKDLPELRSFLGAAARASQEAEQDTHLIVLCLPSSGLGRALEALAEDYDDEKIARWQARELREAMAPEPSIRDIVVDEAGGLRAHKDDDLREEYSEVPLTYKRKEGLPGDELADYLATNHRELGVRDERGLYELLKNQRRS